MFPFHSIAPSVLSECPSPFQGPFVLKKKKVYESPYAFFKLLISTPFAVTCLSWMIQASVQSEGGLQ